MDISEERKKQMQQMVRRFEQVPGFKAMFNRGFIREAGKHPLGTVDTEKLSQEILQILGAEDPKEE